MAIILWISLFLGDTILQLFGISIDSFRIAGGILVVTIAMSMISGKLGEDKQNKQEKSETAVRESIGVVPLALPLMAGPGAISSTIVWGTRYHSISYLFGFFVAIALFALCCWGLFRMFSDKKYGSPQNAITVWKDHMVSQGFGYRLGTDLPGEQRGLIPNAKFYDKAYRGSWNGLTVISISIGQGEILTTPLQIANLGATIANRGHFITPHIVKEIQDHELDSIYRTPRVTSIDREYYDEVAEGMRAAVTGSTGSATCRMVGTILPGVEACGKTGTAQNRGKDHSVFMGFAPMNNPKIAIAVYVENGGFGATYGVPIGAMMMDQYLHGKLSPENEIRAEEFSNRIILYGDEER